MEMRAIEDVDTIGKDLTPPLSPLAFALHDSFLHSHCSCCSARLPPNHHRSPPLLYCSPRCSSIDSPLHFSSAGHHLLLLPPPPPPSDTSDLRAALRLILRIEKSGKNEFVGGRIGGLMSNRKELMSDSEFSDKIREGAKIMAAARGGEGGGADFEEEMLCVVLTNAVEVLDNEGHSVGIAVYGTNFSWVNHSCSPNACYWFLAPTASNSGDEPEPRQFLISPAAVHGVEGRVCDECELGKKVDLVGPRVVIRSIKEIKKGEEVSISYTDLLQPKEMRQADLWLKYRFTCHCQRCNAMPLAYVDHALQDSSSFHLNSTIPISAPKFSQGVLIKKSAEYIDDVISEYLSFGDAESCCEKLENYFIDDASSIKIGLNPLHHLSLNAYTTLASAYKVRAIESLARGSRDAFRMNRISAAYSLLLAGVTHQLFLSERSLITSVANFWIGAGKSLLDFARSALWNLFAFASGLPSLPSYYKCSNCSLMDMFDSNLADIENAVLSDISKKFLDCASDITPEVWRFLVSDHFYLEGIEDPFDLKCVITRVSGCKERYQEHVRVGIYQLGIHCLAYGGILSTICYGEDSFLTSSVRRLLNVEGT